MRYLASLLTLFTLQAHAFCVPGEGTRNAEWAGLLIFEEGVAQQVITTPIWVLQHDDGTYIPILVPVIQQQAMPPEVQHALCQMSCIGYQVQSGMCWNSNQSMTITGGQLEVLDSQGSGYPPVLKGTLHTSVGDITIKSLFVESNDNWTGGSISYQQGEWMTQTVPLRVRD